jgi:hypothetical protein
MEKLTAVEWLIDNLHYLHSTKWDDILIKAKQMEKEQIIEARNDGFKVSGEGFNGEYGIEDFNFLTEEIKSEQYYNETFNK